MPLAVAGQSMPAGTCLLLSALLWLSTTHADLLRLTTSGYVHGKVIHLPDGAQVLAFLGVPYAAPPVDELRFKPPKDPPPWADAWNATDFGPVCHQPSALKVWVMEEEEGSRSLKERKLQEFNMSEDCLNLNVYTPRNPARLLPVMVYIHGGSYFVNAGRFYPGEKLASMDVVVITFNYRLGPLGFLSTEDSSATGNYGLLDQVHVLRWIQANIQVFGGDRTKVTLFGNSAGGASVTFHLLSPLTKGLFSSAIAQSGCLFAPWALQVHPSSHAIKLAQDLGCPSQPTRDLVDCIRTFSPDLILQKAALADGLLIAFAPVVDGPSGGSYLPDHPEKLITSGRFQSVPFMAGLTKEEVSIWFQAVGPEMEVSTMKAGVHKFSKELLLHKNVSQVNQAAVTHTLTVQYLHKRGIIDHRTGKGNTMAIADLISDAGLKAPCVRLLQTLAPYFNDTIYMYEFGYYSDDDIRSGRQAWVGAYHESELQYVFGEPHLNYTNALRKHKDRIVSDFVMKMWVNFANYGDPTPISHNPLNITWVPYTYKHQVHLQIVENPQMEENYLMESALFWNSFFPILTDYSMEELESPCQLNRRRWLVWLLSTLICLLLLTCVALTIYIIRRRQILHVVKHAALSPENSTTV